MTKVRHVAVVARAVFPFHGLGGLERSVYDLVRYLAGAGVRVTLITRTPRPALRDRYPGSHHPICSIRTFPFAGRGAARP